LLEDAGNAQSLTVELLDHFLVLLGCRFAAFVQPFSLGNSFALALRHDLALELRDRTEQVKNELAGCAAGGPDDNAKLCFLCLNPVYNLHQIAHRTRQVINSARTARENPLTLHRVHLGQADHRALEIVIFFRARAGRR
jgi:hypothetical protein